MKRDALPLPEKPSRRRGARRAAPEQGKGREAALPLLDLIEGHYRHRNDPSHRENPAADLVGALADDGNLTHLVGAAVKVRDRFSGYKIRGRWMTEGYTTLRNTVWLVRNSRAGQGNNPLALGAVVAEVQTLLEAGESLQDVVEALCELLVHP